MSSNAISNPTEPTEINQSLSQSSQVSSNPNAARSGQFNSQTNGTAKSGDANELEAFRAALATDSLKKQLKAVRSLAAMGDVAEHILIEFVGDRMSAQNPEEPTPAHGSAYQYLYGRSSAAAKALIEEFPDGLVCPQSDQGVDYSELQMLLVKKEYQAADKLTNQKLCELAGESAIERKWVYFTEVGRFPEIDLLAIDAIWQLYSEGKFGWSQQQAMWTRLGKDWERLWIQLLWKSAEGSWTRYPTEFIWDLEAAPPAHLPLSNQLRGVRVMNELLSHPAWNR